MLVPLTGDKVDPGMKEGTPVAIIMGVVVEAGAESGPTVGDKVSVGVGTSIGANNGAMVYGDSVTIGARVRIYGLNVGSVGGSDDLVVGGS